MLPIGCKSLDLLIGGGLPLRVITQFYGPAGSGKTNVCLQALYTASKLGKRIAYIDTEGGFHEKRLEQLSGAWKEKVLKATTLFEPTTFEEQKKAIEDAVTKSFNLIIADSITSLYRLEMSDETAKETNKELSRQMQLLLAYARNSNVPVLVTNQVYSDFGSGKIEPVGGDVLKYNSKVIVELQPLEEMSGLRRAVLRKHLYKKEGASADFMIDAHGISDKA